MTAPGRKTFLAKAILTNFGSLATPGNKCEIRVGSGVADYHNYIVGSPLIAYPPKGGFVIKAIDPSIVAHRSGITGSPVFSAVDFFAVYADCATSKEANLGLDAIDVYYGHYITGGTSVDPDGTFEDVVADDADDISTGRIGALERQGSTVSSLGRIIIGATSASAVLTSTATEFTSVAEKVTFPDNWAAAGFAGLIVDLGVAGTIVNWTRCNFSSDGTEAGEDTRAVLDVVNTTSTTGLVGDLCTFVAFASLNLNQKTFLTSCTFEACGQIDCGGTSTNPGADISGGNIIESTAASAVLWDTNHDPTTELADLSFVSSGTGHAMELGANCPSTIELVRHSYGSVYAAVDGSTGNEVLYNNSGKAITVNITDGPSPTVRNGAGASTVIVNATTLTITGLITGGEFRIYEDDGVDEQDFGTELDGIETLLGSTFAYSHGGIANTIVIQHIATGYEELRQRILLGATSTSVKVFPIVETNL